MSFILNDWRTTALGILGAAATWVTALSALLDASAETSPNWDAAIAATAFAIGLFLAKDRAV